MTTSSGSHKEIGFLCDNTHPYGEIEPDERMAADVGFQALTARGNEDEGGDT